MHHFAAILLNGLRDYGCAGQLGLEATPDEYVAAMVAVFREVRRVLRSDGTLWLNIGDSYAANRTYQVSDSKHLSHDYGASNAQRVPVGLKPKDLIGLPWMVAFALRADGWYLRSEIIWAKKSPMPESVTDRPTSAHEKVFLFAKSQRYFYDALAVAEAAESDHPSGNGFKREPRLSYADADGPRGNDQQWDQVGGTRNLRNVWTLGPEPYPGSHFAVFPTEIPRRAILAGTSARGVCPKCLAPWVRQSETTLVPGPKAAKTFVVDARDAAADPNDQGSNRQKDGHKPGWRNDTKTLGWSPSCRCPAAEPVPATVLDPFSGAGTSLMVADRLGRNAIGIELNPAYAEMARRRIEQDAGLFAEVAAE